MLKQLIFVLFLVAITATGWAQSYSWSLKQSGSSLGDPITSDPNNSNIIFYGSNAQIYRSTDRGETFSNWGTPIPSSTKIKNIITTAKSSQTMIAAIEASTDKIVKTTDGGATWVVTLNNATFSYFGIPMTPDPSHPDTIYTMSNNIFYKSYDFGSTWTQVSTTSLFATPCDIEVFPDSSHIILVGDNTTGIFRSTNYGVTWTTVYTTSGEIPTIAIDGRNKGTAYGTKWGGGGGLVKSTDFGATWTLIPFFTGQSMWGVDIAPENSNFIMVGRYSGSNIYITRDGGQNWITTTLSASNYSVNIIDTLTIFAAQSPGCYKATVPFVPVELTGFYATVSDGEVILSWSTATELNNARFELERRTASLTDDWTKVSEVEGHGTTTIQRRYMLTDKPAATGVYLYRLKQIDYDGKFEYSNTIEVTTETPMEFSLSQNYPNPFNPSTSIAFSLMEQAEVNLAVFDITGREVTNIIENKVLPAGNHSIEFNASNLNSGVYLYRLKAGSKSLTKKLTLLK
ncbi:hypothetical protein MASR2M39_02880 [Ignavibacteriales bacterium]